MYTIIMQQKYRLPCWFKRKRSERLFRYRAKLEGNLFRCVRARGHLGANDAKIVRSRDAQCLSNRPQVFMVYKLINHAGCWQNTRRICKQQWFTNSSSVQPTSQVVYQPITRRKLVVYCFYIIIQKTRDFSVGLPAQ